MALFRMPNIVGRDYAPGIQINAPGESCVAPVVNFRAMPWPNAVPSLSTLASFEGLARDRPIQQQIDALAVLPSKWLFIGGVVQKSQG